MPNFVHLVSGSERALGVGESFGQYQKGVADLLLACLIPVGDFEPARTAGLRDRDRVLQGMNLLDILRIIWIDEYADPKRDIAGADLLSGIRVRAGPVDDLGRVMVLSITCIDMNRAPASGSVTVIGPASRSKTESEYRVSRLGRTMGNSIDMGSR